MIPRVATLPRATLFAVVIALLAWRVSPDFLHGMSLGALLVYSFIFSYSWVVFYALVLYPQLLSPLRHMRGPKTKVTLAAPAALSRNIEPGKPFMSLMEEYQDEELVLIDVFRDLVTVTKPTILADLFVHRPYDFIKPPNANKFLKQILGTGLVTVEGDQHKFMRKNTLPAFNFRHIKDLYPMMWKKSIVFTQILSPDPSIASLGQDKDNIIDLNTLANKVTLDIIGVAGLGREFDSMHNSDDPLAQAYETLLRPSTEGAAYFVSCMIFGYSTIRLLPWRMNRMFDQVKLKIVHTCSILLQEKREALKRNPDEHIDILSLLIKTNNFSDSELTDQLLTFLAAGHETTSSSLSWACYLLSKNQDIMNTLREELQKNILLDENGDPLVDIASTLERLPYLNGVINETLRLYPTVPQTAREAIRDTTLGRYQIPTGTRIIVSPSAIGRSALFWGPDSKEFRPERWITNDKPNQTGGASSNYEFLTFLHGPRSCIGQGFAKAEMRCLLATMVLAYTWELAMPDEKVIPGGAVTIKPANGLFLKMKPIDNRDKDGCPSGRSRAGDEDGLDAENPTNFSRAKKLRIVAAGITLTVNSALGSSLPSGAARDIARHFVLTDSVQPVLLNSLFLLGYAIGPLFCGPLSEHLGRRPILVGTFIAYLLFTMACPLSPTYPALLTFRFLAGTAAAAPHIVIGALYADIYDHPDSRGRAMAYFMCATAITPPIGPLISGYTTHISWKLCFWIGLGITGLSMPLVWSLPGTCAQVIQTRVRRKNGTQDVAAGESAATLWKQLSVALSRPWIMVVREPVVLFSSLYLALAYSILYLFFQAYPIIFQGTLANTKSYTTK